MASAGCPQVLRQPLCFIRGHYLCQGAAKTSRCKNSCTGFLRACSSYQIVRLRPVILIEALSTTAGHVLSYSNLTVLGLLPSHESHYLPLVSAWLLLFQACPHSNSWRFPLSALPGTLLLGFQVLPYLPSQLQAGQLFINQSEMIKNSFIQH